MGCLPQWPVRIPDCSVRYCLGCQPSSLQATTLALRRLGMTRSVALVERDVVGSEATPDAFDSIVMSELLEHLENPHRALRVAYRSLRPGGRIFLNVPVNSPALDHLFLWHDAEEVGGWSAIPDSISWKAGNYRLPDRRSKVCPAAAARHLMRDDRVQARLGRPGQPAMRQCRRPFAQNGEVDAQRSRDNPRYRRPDPEYLSGSATSRLAATLLPRISPAGTRLPMLCSSWQSRTISVSASIRK